MLVTYLVLRHKRILFEEREYFLGDTVKQSVFVYFNQKKIMISFLMPVYKKLYIRIFSFLGNLQIHLIPRFTRSPLTKMKK